jgi:hypothetical protein
VNYVVESPTPEIEAEAFVRGEGRRRIALADFRRSWVVVALGARRSDVLGLAALEEAFAAGGAVVLAATPDELASVEDEYGDEPVRFPILAEVAENRSLTVIADPEGVVRYVGVRQSARETLAVLESLIYAPFELSAAA